MSSIPVVGSSDVLSFVWYNLQLSLLLGLPLHFLELLMFVISDVLLWLVVERPGAILPIIALYV